MKYEVRTSYPAYEDGTDEVHTSYPAYEDGTDRVF
jgi:hypothetical protein